jgi:lysophospholipase L1-like esterase
LVTTVLLAGVLLGCSGSHERTIPVSPAGPRSVYVALGNGETMGNGVANRIRDAWPQIVYRQVFPRATVFANFGQTDVTVAEAMRTQLAPALALHPTVATVELTEDVFLTRDAAAYESDLTTLVRRLQRGGRTLVVVGNLVPDDREPGVLACLPEPPPGAGACTIGPIDPGVQAARAAEFDAAIARVATRTGAPLADLHRAFLRARAAGREDALWTGNTFSPNERGHALIARTFAVVLRHALAARARTSG